MKLTPTIAAIILSVGIASADSCTMGIDVLDQTITVGGTHGQSCHATIWLQDDVTKDPVARTEIGCSAGSTASIFVRGWNYNFRMNSGTQESGKLNDGDAEVSREFVGAAVPFNEHYSHTYFGAANVAITNIAYAKVSCPLKDP